MNDAVDNTIVADELPAEDRAAVERVVEERAVAVETKKAAEAKVATTSGDGTVRTSGGYAVKFHPVAANVLREARARIPDPLMHTFTHPDSGKEMENPAHPEYIQELAAVEEKRIQASMNAMLLFGLELVDPVPEDNEWLMKLKHIGLVSDKEYAEAIGAEGKFLRELLYKNYIVSDAGVLNELAKVSGVTQEMIAQARASFPSNTK